MRPTCAAKVQSGWYSGPQPADHDWLPFRYDMVATKNVARTLLLQLSGDKVATERRTTAAWVNDSLMFLSFCAAAACASRPRCDK